MTLEQIDEIVSTESQCVSRVDLGECNRDCADCDLLLPTRDILTAYATLRVILQVCIKTLPNEDFPFDFEEIFDKWGISKRPTGSSTQTAQ